MNERIVLRHLSGSRANQVEEFPIHLFKEITVGRDPSCEVKFDPDKEDLVSRKHTKIVLDKSDPPEFSLADLGSRNGTFLNKQRIFGSAKLALGDVVQFGAGGPELQFDMEPRPQGVVRPTRLAEPILANAPPAPPTRDAYAPPPMAAPPPPPMTAPPMTAPPPPAPAGVGKATVERLIAQQGAKTRSTTLLVTLAAGVIVVAAVAALVFLRKPQVLTPKKGLSPTEIAQANTDSVVFFEVGWKLVDMESGRQLNHVYIPNERKVEPPQQQQAPPQQQGSSDQPQQQAAPDQQQPPAQGQQPPPPQTEPIVPGAGPALPVFVMLGENVVEPLLTTDDGNGKYRAIGGNHTGSGFVVSSDGFILTNRHVASTWHTSYMWPPDARAGILLVFDAGLNIKQRAVIGAQQFPQWVPANAKFVLQGSFDPNSMRLMGKALKGKNVEGRNDYLDVTFARERIRIPAKLARVSDRIDVAMVKIDIPRSLKKVEMFDNYDSAKPGDAAMVMGYPAVSPDIVAVTRSKDVFNPEIEAKVIPDPTVSVGNIGRVLREQVGLGEGVISTFGDVYQLTINSTGGGNSGGPVFDEQGRVVAIYTSGRRLDAQISFAVPIRYGMELMGHTRTAR